MQHNLLDDFNNSYFVNPPEIHEWYKHNPFSDHEKQNLFDIYNDIKNDPRPYGYSHTLEKEFLRIIIIHHYERGGHIVLPAYFTSSESGVENVPDPKYISIWSYRDEVGDYFKRLMQLTYNHVLPDGKIIEYIFDHDNHYKDSHDAEMFFNMKKIREIHKLEKELSSELDIQTIGNKVINKI